MYALKGRDAGAIEKGRNFAPEGASITSTTKSIINI
jgi:hypothetical protein